MRAQVNSPRLLAVLAVMACIFFSACSDIPTDSGLIEEHKTHSVPAEGKARLFELSDFNAETGFSKDDLLDVVGIIIGFRDSTVSSSEVASRYGIASRYEYETVFLGMAGSVSVLELPSILEEMANDPDILWVEPDLALSAIETVVNTTLGLLDLTTYTLLGLLQTEQVTPWSIPAIDAHRSWTRSGNGSGSVSVDVYILDTGATHSDLNVVECLDFTQGDVRACGLISDLDLNAHGTAISGAAAARDNSRGVVGVVPDARVHALKVLDDNGSAPFSRVIAGIEYLTKRKLANPAVPMVANVSLGADIHTTYQSSLDRAVSASIGSGISYVVAAGNENIDASTISPAHVPEAITVGAFDKHGSFSSFSNYGSIVDILAPGEDVEALTSGDAVYYLSGTSIAAPHVTGAVALMLARHPDMSPATAHSLIVAKSKSGVKAVPTGTTDRRLNVKNLP